jgi:hypothetical protein
VRWLALALACLALTGCETTQEKSAKLEKAALKAAKKLPVGTGAVKIGRPSSAVSVVSSTLLAGTEGTAVVVTLEDHTGTGRRELPIAVTVHGASQAVAYSNTGGGLARSLVSVPLVPAHGQTTWIDDQLPSGTTGALTVQVGEGKAASVAATEVAIESQKLEEEAGGVASVRGTVVNRSAVAQHELVVDAVTRHAGRITSAGRAILSSLAAGGSSSFQIFLVGTPGRGAQLSVTAASSSVG